MAYKDELIWDNKELNHEFGGNEINALKDLYIKSLDLFKNIFILRDLHHQFTDSIENTWYRDLYCFYTFVFLKYLKYLEINLDIETIKLLDELFNSGDEDNIIIACNMLMNLKLKENETVIQEG